MEYSDYMLKEVVVIEGLCILGCLNIGVVIKKKYKCIVCSAQLQCSKGVLVEFKFTSCGYE